MRFILPVLLLLSNTVFAFDLTSVKTKGSIIENPYVMSVTSVIAIPKEDNFKRGEMTIYQSRWSVPLLNDLAEVRYVYRLQKNKSAPMVFVIPGTGGTQESSGALFIAEKMYKMGYHVLTVSNPFSWGFAVGGSRRGLPGYTPEDSQDLYTVLEKVSARLKNNNGLNPESYNLIGYSLGGLQSVFLKDLDEVKGSFNFKNVLSVNPPVDLLYSIQQLDRIYAQGDALSRGRKLWVYNMVLEVGQKYMNGKESLNDLKTVQKIFDELKFNNNDLAYLIGTSFRDSLRDVIYSSQQVKDLGILKSRITKNRRNARIEESRTFSYVDYLRRFIFPEISKTRSDANSFEDINNDASMYQYAEFIRERPNMYLMHSTDDFILKSEDINFLKSSFGQRALLLPYGGHCGALNFPQFDAYLNQIFGKQSAPTPVAAK